LIDLTGADTVLIAVRLIGKFDVRVFEPVQDFSPYRVCQGFYYFVEVEVHGVGARDVNNAISRWTEL
jgi:hypothetical protein